jgi:restriction system protein
VHFKETVSSKGPASQHEINTFGGVAALKLLDLRDIDAPLADVRAYLAARYEQRFTMNTTLFEQTVASVFRDLGYEARAVGRSGDDGIDVVLDGPDGSTIGVQVKRYKGRIGVHQIRELTGALVINKLTRGIFVTTSDFESGAPRTAALSESEGKPIELYNADRFYDALKLSQLKEGKPFDEFLSELQHRPLTLIHTNRDHGPA